MQHDKETHLSWFDPDMITYPVTALPSCNSALLRERERERAKKDGRDRKKDPRFSQQMMIHPFQSVLNTSYFTNYC